jgi:hypothetical protein
MEQAPITPAPKKKWHRDNILCGDLNKPLVTIITSVLNGASTLPVTISSVANQSYGNIQFIVADGGSADSTVKIIFQYGDVVDHWFSEKDRGIYDAWNKALKFAKGKWIVFLGADDALTPEAIERLVEVAEKSHHGDVDFVSGRVTLLRGEQSLRTVGAPWNWGQFRKYMCVAHVGALHNRKFFEKFGEFDSSFRIAGDYEMLLRAGSELRTGFADCVVAKMGVGGASSQGEKVCKEGLRAQLKHGCCGRLEGRVFCAWAIGKWRARTLIDTVQRIFPVIFRRP